jgi:hypothetical protein
MKVTLDIFSGRPNPCWTMRPEDEKELARQLAGLPPAKEVPGGDGLGYRGFVITNHAGQSGRPAEVRVFEGVVTIRSDAGISTFRDTNFLEKWLAEQAREQGLESLLATVPGL